MKGMRRLEAPAATSLFERIQRSPLRNLDPRFTPETDVARLEQEHPELVAAEEKGVMLLKPWGDWLWLVYGFADRDALRQRFQPLLERLVKGLDAARLPGGQARLPDGQARWPDGIRVRFTDHPNRPFVEPVLVGCAFELIDEWMEMDLFELPEAGPPSPQVAAGYFLRSATESDLPEYVELDRQAFGAPRPMSLEAARERLASATLFQVLVSEADGRLAGFLSLLRWPQATGAVDDIAVRPDLQRRGLGEAMMRWALAWFRQEGMRRAWLDVLLDNAPALSLYKKLGFTPGTTGLTYRRPLDKKEVGRILGRQRGTYIKFGGWR
jgi:ribosomal-protein-alanine N-acetyltransferase